MDFSDLKLNNKDPVYAQLVAYVKRSIATGAACDGEALPSRREVAALLGINPNTVQKAFKQLEDEWLIETPRNAASVLRVSNESMERIREELGQAFVREFIAQARENGLGYKRVIEFISHFWEEDV